jgi:peptidoglycan/LPS O-acetylase OafA/YrhL
MAEGRLKELDGLRALAILLVVAWHYLGAHSGSSAAAQIFIFGRSGVDLFFVLSGYLITSTLLEHKGSPGYFSAFYGRRSFRILPIYFVMVLIFAAGQRGTRAVALFDGTIPWWAYAAGLQNFWMAAQQTYGASWLSMTWSLAVEEQFYLLFPLLVFLAPARVLPALLCSLLIACPIARAYSASNGDDFGYYVLMPMRADVLAAGALIAILHERTTPSMLRAGKFALAFSAALFPLYMFLGNSSEFVSAAVGHSYLVLLYGALVFVIVHSRGAPSLAILRSHTAAFFASISYALYLVHTNILFLLLGLMRSGQPVTTWEGAGLRIVSFAISVALCAASYRYFERPLIRYAHQRFQFTERGHSAQTVTES